MTDQEAEQISGTFARDQNDAEILDITKQVARHCIHLKAIGLSEGAVVMLAQDFQRLLMGDGLYVDCEDDE